MHGPADITGAGTMGPGPGTASGDSWLDEAARLPLAFAQVREDPRLDLAVVECLGGDTRVLMVASGGETVAALVASGRVAHLEAVDPNPAQLVLGRLKLRLLATADVRARLELLGHASLPAPERRARLLAHLAALGAAADALGPLPVVSSDGPDFAGRYERLFARLHHRLEPEAADLDGLLALADVPEQTRRARPGTRLGDALDAAFREVFAHDNLMRLFGEAATHDPVEPFHLHFARRTRHALATLPAATNPWLHQLLAGRFPPAARYDWLDALPGGCVEVRWEARTIESALASASAGSFDFVHVSNVLDWLSEGDARRLLALAARALRPGGFVLVRQLASAHDVPRLGGGFAWDSARSEALHARDRSFLYRGLHLGRRP